MRCPVCNANNPAGALFCYQCGLSLAAPASAPNLPPAYNPPGLSDYPSGPTPPSSETYGYAPPPANYPPPTNYPYPQPGQYYPPSPNYGPPGPSSYPPPYYGAALPNGAALLEYHPLAEGVVGLPLEIQQEPTNYYSYVNQENRLVFARPIGFWARVAAGVLDGIIIGGPYLCIGGLLISLSSPGLSSTSRLDPTLSGWFSLLGVIIFFAYYYFTAIAGGQSLGKKILKMRVIMLNGNKPNHLSAFLRFAIGYLFSTNFFAISLIALLIGFGLESVAGAAILGLLAFGWGFWAIGLDDLKQGWHDKLARTLVVATTEYVENTHFYFPRRGW